MAETPSLSEFRIRTETRLQELLPDPAQRPGRLHEAMRYSALAPGKRLRPLMTLAACVSVGGDWEAALDAACATELVHCFSLIHDDLPAIDNDELRRGVPTCHMVYGEGLALLAGDALFALAFDAIGGLSAPAERVVRCLRALASASGSAGLVGGEVVDVLTEGKPFDLDTLEFIHSRKTGALIAACCEIGAVLGGGSEAEIASRVGYGERIGLAFQVVDDILNETGEADKLGKAVGSDKERQKATYPALIGLDASRELAERLRSEALAGLGPEPTELLVELAGFTITRSH